MYYLKITKSFNKSYCLMMKRGMDISLLDDVIDLLRSGETLEQKYKDHALAGSYLGFRECHI